MGRFTVRFLYGWGQGLVGLYPFFLGGVRWWGIFSWLPAANTSNRHSNQENIRSSSWL